MVLVLMELELAITRKYEIMLQKCIFYRFLYIRLNSRFNFKIKKSLVYAIRVALPVTGTREAIASPAYACVSNEEN